MLATLSTPLLPATSQLARSVAPPLMGFGPSPKDKDPDPSIASVLAICKADQERRFQLAAAGAGSFVPGGQELITELPGALPPFGFFDPLTLAPEDRREALFMREAEIMHGRTSMLAVLGLLVQERLFHPFAPTLSDNSAVGQFLQAPQVLSWTLAFVVGLAELQRTNVGFVRDEQRILKRSYEPGNLNFDPLSLLPTGANERKAMQEKELNNGRLAMVAIAGMFAQESVTGQGIFA